MYSSVRQLVRLQGPVLRVLLVLGALASAPAWPQATAATEGEREWLNSERIEARFGSYAIEVLESADGVRVSNLYSSDGSDTCRTFAVVYLPSEVDPAFAAEHAAILDGASIGATFIASGWAVTKVHRYFGLLSNGTRTDRLMGGLGEVPLAAHAYRLEVSRQGERHNYATIVEVHHPDYLELDDLRRIYAAGALWPTPLDTETAEKLVLTLEKMNSG